MTLRERAIKEVVEWTKDEIKELYARILYRLNNGEIIKNDVYGFRKMFNEELGANKRRIVLHALMFKCRHPIYTTDARQYLLYAKNGLDTYQTRVEEQFVDMVNEMGYFDRELKVSNHGLYLE